MGKNMGRVVSSSSFFSRVPLWGCIVELHDSELHDSAVRRSGRRRHASDRLNWKEVPLRELNLIG